MTADETAASRALLASTRLLVARVFALCKDGESNAERIDEANRHIRSIMRMIDSEGVEAQPRHN